MSASVIGHPYGIYTALMGHGYVIGTDNAFEDDLKCGVLLDPLNILPCQVVLDLMHERPFLVIDVPHLELVPQLIEQL